VNSRDKKVSANSYFGRARSRVEPQCWSWLICTTRVEIYDNVSRDNGDCSFQSANGRKEKTMTTTTRNNHQHGHSPYIFVVSTMDSPFVRLPWSYFRMDSIRQWAADRHCYLHNTSSSSKSKRSRQQERQQTRSYKSPPSSSYFGAFILLMAFPQHQQQQSCSSSSFTMNSSHATSFSTGITGSEK